jgi:hypothetical protein
MGETEARELQLYIENDLRLYHSQEVPIIKNLLRKMKRGVYDHEKSVKLWGYLIEIGAKKYAREFDRPENWHKIFDVGTRRAVARVFADDFLQKAKSGEYTLKMFKNPALPLTDPRMAFHRPLSHEEAREIAGGRRERAKQLLKTYRELTPFLRGGERKGPAMRAYAETGEALQEQLRRLYGLPPLSLVKTFEKIASMETAAAHKKPWYGKPPTPAEKAAAKKWLKANPPKIDLYSRAGKYLSSTKLYHSIREAVAAWNRKFPYRPAGFGRYNPNPVCEKMKKHLRRDIKDFKSIEKKVRGMRRDDERTIRGNPGIVDAIRPGDTVIIVNRFGQERKGRAVMRSTYGGWVLNMGGPHGTPGIADEDNIVKVIPRKNPMTDRESAMLLRMARTEHREGKVFRQGSYTRARAEGRASAFRAAVRIAGSRRAKKVSLKMGKSQISNPLNRAEAGWKGNLKLNPARSLSPIIIYDKTESITMQKGRGPYKGQRFIHNFSTKPTQYGIPAGTVVKYPDGRTFRLTTRSVMLSGKNHLWKKFKA